MRIVLSRANLVLILLGTLGCKPLEGHNDEASTQDSTPADAHASPAGTSATASAADGGDRVVAPLPPATPEVCGGLLLPPPEACLGDDLAEPNDEDNPRWLETDPLCGYVQANVSPDDQRDGYTFMTAKSDPVMVEISYLASSSASLQQVIYDATGLSISSENAERTASSAAAHAVVQTTADVRYMVSVRDVDNNDSCQSYALRVDPQFCTDNDEDNDDLEHATQLPWDAHEQASTKGTVYQGDDDCFEVTTTRADPVLLTGSYSANASDTVQVRREVYDEAGRSRSSSSGERTGTTESFMDWLSAPTKGSVLRVLLSASGTGCASFNLSLDAAACTDAFEDNDQLAQAAPLTLGNDVNATIIAGDDDHYALPSLANGTCSVTYEIASGQTQQLVITVYDDTGVSVASDSNGELNGRVKTLHATWMDRSAIDVEVTGAGMYCQPYTLHCE